MDMKGEIESMGPGSNDDGPINVGDIVKSIADAALDEAKEAVEDE